MRTVTGPTDNVVIVGAGLGGLSAALRLAGAGRNVTVLEREGVPGGRAGVWDQGGYRFDTGPTVLTMPELIADALECVGESLDDWLDLEPLDPIYRAHYPDGTTLDVHADIEQMSTEIAESIGGDEAAGYQRFADHVSQLYRLEIDNFIDRNIDSPFDLVTPAIAKLAAIGGFRRLANDVGRYFKDQRTQRVFSFQSMYAGLSPFDALALYGVISYMDSVAGVYFPRGGLHEVPTALAAAAEKHGVKIRYNTEVTKVEHRNGRAWAVHTNFGERIAADVVVLNPDLPVAYRDLLGMQPLSVRRLQYSPSCYLLLAGSSSHYEKISHHNIHFGKSWRGVFSELIDEHVVMSDPSFLVSNPTRGDQSLAPNDRHGYYVLFPTPNMDADINWDEESPRYREHVLSTLEAVGYIGFRDGIEVERVTTPKDWQASGLERGAPFAASHSFLQTGPFRPRNIWGENVVFVGSGTTPGVGVPMVLISGRLAAQRITG